MESSRGFANALELDLFARCDMLLSTSNLTSSANQVEALERIHLGDREGTENGRAK